MPEEVSEATPATTPAAPAPAAEAPQLLFDNIASYTYLRNFADAVAKIRSFDRDALLKLKEKSPELFDDGPVLKFKANPTRAQIIKAIFKNKAAFGLATVNKSEYLRIVNFAATATNNTDIAPSPDECDILRMRYTTNRDRHAQAARDEYQNTQAEMKKARKARNRGRRGVAVRVVGLSAAILGALGLTGLFGWGVATVVMGAVTSTFGIATGAALGGVVLGIVFGRALIRGIGKLMVASVNAIRRARERSKGARAKYKELKRAQKRNKTAMLSSQSQLEFDNAYESANAWPGRRLGREAADEYERASEAARRTAESSLFFDEMAYAERETRGIERPEIAPAPAPAPEVEAASTYEEEPIAREVEAEESYEPTLEPDPDGPSGGSRSRRSESETESSRGPAPRPAPVVPTYSPVFEGREPAAAERTTTERVAAPAPAPAPARETTAPTRPAPAPAPAASTRRAPAEEEFVAPVREPVMPEVDPRARTARGTARAIEEEETIAPVLEEEPHPVDPRFRTARGGGVRVEDAAPESGKDGGALFRDAIEKYAEDRAAAKVAEKNGETPPKVESQREFKDRMAAAIRQQALDKIAARNAERAAAKSGETPVKAESAPVAPATAAPVAETAAPATPATSAAPAKTPKAKPTKEELEERYYQAYKKFKNERAKNLASSQAQFGETRPGALDDDGYVKNDHAIEFVTFGSGYQKKALEAANNDLAKARNAYLSSVELSKRGKTQETVERKFDKRYARDCAQAEKEYQGDTKVDAKFRKDHPEYYHRSGEKSGQLKEAYVGAYNAYLVETKDRADLRAARAAARETATVYASTGTGAATATAPVAAPESRPDVIIPTKPERRETAAPAPAPVETAPAETASRTAEQEAEIEKTRAQIRELNSRGLTNEQIMDAWARGLTNEDLLGRTAERAATEVAAESAAPAPAPTEDAAPGASAPAPAPAVDPEALKQLSPVDRFKDELGDEAFQIFGDDCLRDLREMRFSDQEKLGKTLQERVNKLMNIRIENALNTKKGAEKLRAEILDRVAYVNFEQTLNETQRAELGRLAGVDLAKVLDDIKTNGGKKTLENIDKNIEAYNTFVEFVENDKERDQNYRKPEFNEMVKAEVAKKKERELKELGSTEEERMAAVADQIIHQAILDGKIGSLTQEVEDNAARAMTTKNYLDNLTDTQREVLENDYAKPEFESLGKKQLKALNARGVENYKQYLKTMVRDVVNNGNVPTKEQQEKGEVPELNAYVNAEMSQELNSAIVESPEKLHALAEDSKMRDGEYLMMMVDELTGGEGVSNEAVGFGLKTADVALLNEKIEANYNDLQERIANRASTKAKEAVKGAAKTAGQKIAEGAKTAGKAIAEGAKTAGQKIAEGTKVAGQKIVEGTKVAGHKIAEGAKVAGHKVAEVAGAAKDKVVNKFNELTNREPKPQEVEYFEAVEDYLAHHDSTNVEEIVSDILKTYNFGGKPNETDRKAVEEEVKSKLKLRAATTKAAAPEDEEDLGK